MSSSSSPSPLHPPSSAKAAAPTDPLESKDGRRRRPRRHPRRQQPRRSILLDRSRSRRSNIQGSSKDLDDGNNVHNGKAKVNKVVRFHPRAAVHVTPSRSSMTSEERAGVWYSPSDNRTFQMDVLETAHVMRTAAAGMGEDEDEEDDEAVVLQFVDDSKGEAEEDRRRRLRRRRERVRKREKRALDGGGRCARGLEHMRTPERIERRRKVKRDVREAVLREQAAQKEKRTRNPVAVAEASLVVSEASRAIALRRAKRDEAFVRSMIEAEEIELEIEREIERRRRKTGDGGDKRYKRRKSNESLVLLATAMDVHDKERPDREDEPPRRRRMPSFPALNKCRDDEQDHEEDDSSEDERDKANQRHSSPLTLSDEVDSVIDSLLDLVGDSKEASRAASSSATSSSKTLCSLDHPTCEDDDDNDDDDASTASSSSDDDEEEEDEDSSKYMTTSRPSQSRQNGPEKYFYDDAHQNDLALAETLKELSANGGGNDDCDDSKILQRAWRRKMIAERLRQAMERATAEMEEEIATSLLF